MLNELNATSNLSRSHDSRNSKIFSLKVKIVWFSVFTMESLFILILNAVALSIFFKKSFLIKKSTFLLINLTFADLLVGLTIPAIFAEDFVKDPNIKIAFYLPLLLAAYESMLSLTVMALERVFAIYFPFRHRLLKRSHYLWCILLTWILAAVVSFILLKELNGYHWMTSLHTPAISYFQISFTSILTITIVSSYFAIWIKVTFHKRFNSQRNEKENRNMTKTLSIVTLIFLVTWWPVNVFEKLDGVDSDQSLEYGMYSLVYSNSFLNCIVYSVRIPEFRKQLFAILRKAKRLECVFGPEEMFSGTNGASVIDTNSCSVELKTIRQLK